MKKGMIIKILIIIGIVAIIWWQFGVGNKVEVTNFEECIEAGNLAMESYPRQCNNEGENFIEEIDQPINLGNPTSADNAPPGSIHNLPVPDAVSAVRMLIADKLGISEGLVIIMTAYKKDWPNACLGLALEDEICSQVITPGYEVTIQAQGREFIYHTNQDGSVLRENK